VRIKQGFCQQHGEIRLIKKSTVR